MKIHISLGVIGGLFSIAMLSMAQTPDAAARAAVDAGNQAWVDGVKTEDIKRIIATYAEDAVDCGPAGECIRGREQIERKMTTQLAARGRARSATVKTQGATEQGSFIYEWGQAEATFSGGKDLVEKYLTVWQKQPDGTWKIFRNMVIPDK
ncbi:YybH family protein [Tunturiibacter lichenicola]|uniref:YybH family protein n=1 Tax=Tunturiibacter lichenicola TaxID=2051959 RepID=UPI003D9BC728